MIAKHHIWSANWNLARKQIRVNWCLLISWRVRGERCGKRISSFLKINNGIKILLLVKYDATRSAPKSCLNLGFFHSVKVLDWWLKTSRSGLCERFIQLCRDNRRSRSLSWLLPLGLCWLNFDHRSVLTPEASLTWTCPSVCSASSVSRCHFPSTSDKDL